MVWDMKTMYACLPFSVIGKMLKKTQEAEAAVISVLPLWPTQEWFPLALKLFRNPVPSLSKVRGLATRPGPQTGTKVENDFYELLGQSFKKMAFQRRSLNFSLSLGNKIQHCSMGHV